MAPTDFNSGALVVELAALANTAAIATGAIVGAWLTFLGKKRASASALGFCLGAATGFAVGQAIASILYRSNGRTLIVKAGAGSLHATIPAGLAGSLVASFVVGLLAWRILACKIPIWSFLRVTLGCGIIICVVLACLGSLV